VWPIGRQGGNRLAVLQAHAIENLNDLTELPSHFAVGDVQVAQHKSIAIATTLNGGNDQIAHAAALMDL
jgi:hypothetical protein